MNTEKNGWVLVGHCAVDSGQLMVCDPCYIKSHWEANHFTSPTDEDKNDFSYDGACVTTLRHTAGELAGGVGCVTSTTHGDGRYPVYVRYEFGSPMELRIMLDGAKLSTDGEIVLDCPDCGHDMVGYDCDYCYENED